MVGSPKKREESLTEQQVAADTLEFFDDLLASMPVMTTNDEPPMPITPEKLRQTSLLGSATFIRCLASAYHSLIADHGWTRDQVQAYFKELAGHVGAPLKPGNLWLLALPDAFAVNATAPIGRNQQMRSIVDLIVAWDLTNQRIRVLSR